MATCNGCGVPIAFVATPAGKKMPVDATYATIVVDPTSTLKFVLDDGSVVSARLANDVMVPTATTSGRLPHWSSCRAADRFRAKGRTAP
jgi:hypothetical protein